MRRLSLRERRAELVSAAIRVISRDGLAAASTRAIAAEAGMPLGALHYVFGSREYLIRAVIEQVTDEERLAVWSEAALAGAAGNLESVLLAGLEAYLRLLEADPRRELALFEVAMHAVRHDPGAVQEQWRIYRGAVAETLAYAARLTRVRWTRPLDHLAYDLTAALDGLTVNWLADRDTEAARRHLRSVAGAFATLAVPDD